MNSYIRMDRILLYFLGNSISIVSPFLFTYGLNCLRLKGDMQLSLSDLKSPKYNVGCLIPAGKL